MGTSLGMIDRHYGHLARDGRNHAIRLLDLFTGAEPDVHAVDAAWTSSPRTVAERTQPRAEQAKTESPLTDSNRRPPPYQRACGWLPA